VPSLILVLAGGGLPVLTVRSRCRIVFSESNASAKRDEREQE
jgi:hypothetical protein